MEQGTGLKFEEVMVFSSGEGLPSPGEKNEVEEGRGTPSTRTWEKSTINVTPTLFKFLEQHPLSVCSRKYHTYIYSTFMNPHSSSYLR